MSIDVDTLIDKSKTRRGFRDFAVIIFALKKLKIIKEDEDHGLDESGIVFYKEGRTRLDVLISVLSKLTEE